MSDNFVFTLIVYLIFFVICAVLLRFKYNRLKKDYDNLRSTHNNLKIEIKLLKQENSLLKQFSRQNIDTEQ